MITKRNLTFYSRACFLQTIVSCYRHKQIFALFEGFCASRSGIWSWNVNYFSWKRTYRIEFPNVIMPPKKLQNWLDMISRGKKRARKVDFFSHGFLAKFREINFAKWMIYLVNSYFKVISRNIFSLAFLANQTCQFLITYFHVKSVK